MYLKDFIPAIKYGATFGTARFTVTQAASSGNVDISHPGQIVGCFAVASNGSVFLTADGTPSMLTPTLSNASGSVTWAIPIALGVGSVVYEVVYMP